MEINLDDCMFLFEIIWIVNALNYHLHHKRTVLGNEEIERFDPE